MHGAMDVRICAGTVMDSEALEQHASRTLQEDGDLPDAAQADESRQPAAAGAAPAPDTLMRTSSSAGSQSSAEQKEFRCPICLVMH